MSLSEFVSWNDSLLNTGSEPSLFLIPAFMSVSEEDDSSTTVIWSNRKLVRKIWTCFSIINAPEFYWSWIRNANLQCEICPANFLLQRCRVLQSNLYWCKVSWFSWCYKDIHNMYIFPSNQNIPNQHLLFFSTGNVNKPIIYKPIGVFQHISCHTILWQYSDVQYVPRDSNS